MIETREVCRLCSKSLQRLVNSLFSKQLICEDKWNNPKRLKRKSFALDISILPIIIVVVAMVVGVFMLSEGFAPQGTEGASSDQSSQDQEAHQSIILNSAIFTTGTSASINLIVSNINASSATLSGIVITGLASNAGFTGTLTATILNEVWTCVGSDDGHGQYWTTAGGTLPIAKGESTTITLVRTDGSGADNTSLSSGDILNIRFATTSGKFVQQTFTVL